MAAETKDNDVSNLEKNAAFMDLYSRQIGAYGIETMAKFVQVKVLVVGLKGAGMEIAKNVILAGPKAVTLYDPTPAAPKHQGANFFLPDDKLGQPIADAVVGSLAQLNAGVTVRVASELTVELALEHDVVVFTEGSRQQVRKFNNACRNREVEKEVNGVVAKVASPVAFISVVTMGAYGAMFSDFGPTFTVRDANGEEPVTRVITHISPEGLVTVLNEEEGGKRIGIADNEHEGWVTFSEVKGCTDGAGNSINDVKRLRARAVFDTFMENGRERRRFNPFTVDVGKLEGLSEYIDGGYLHQVKVPVTHKYKSFAQTCLNPGNLPFTDGAKFNRGQQLHLALHAIYAFEEDNGKLPEVNNADHAADVVARAKAYNDAAKLLNANAGEQLLMEVEAVDEDTVFKVALLAGTELQPVCTFFGGVVAQEVVKIAGKYSPLDQWLHLDWLEVLPEERPTDTEMIGSRYDNQIAVFGRAFQDKLLNARTFLVGCGAIGCEMLKNFALIGVGCGADGMVHCTDNDMVEVSNLNRQFLFRSHNVGMQKSEAASAAAKAMNPAFHVNAHVRLVMPSTEDHFNDAFWESLTFVTNALDNIKAREYVDGRCVFYEKALLESGTLGTKCNSQVVVPHLTQSYTDGPQQADEEDSIPMCTLRNFPSLIDHCIEWARAQFTDRFVQPATDASKFVADKGAWLAEVRAAIKSAPNRASAIAQAVPKVRAVKTFLDRAASASFETMVALASSYFHECFRDKIQALVTAYPEDHVKESGAKFWSGSKRFPSVATLDVDNPAHLQYIRAAANILACNFGLRRGPEEEPVPEGHDWRSDDFIKAVLAATPIPEYKPSTTKIAEDGDDADEAGAEEEKEFEALMAALEATSVDGVRFEAADFEKDHDYNFHIDFIHAASNLRAANYKIPEASRHKTKMIAGKIVPAIATATASATGLVMLEMYKIVAGKSRLEDYRDCSNNLGLNSYLMMAPLGPTKATVAYSDIEMCEVTPKPDGFTKWDKTVIATKGPVTLRQFLEKFKAQVGLNVTMLFHACANEDDKPWTGTVLYNADDEEESAEYMDRNLLEVVGEVYDGANCIYPQRNYVAFEVSCADDEEEVFIVPQLVWKFGAAAAKK